VSVFVDTSAWYAAADRKDRHNARAKRVLGGKEPLVTTDHVLVESWLLIHHRLGADAAHRFWAALRDGVAAIESVTNADLERAWAIGESWAAADFSIVDRTSFAVMLRLGVHRAASYDADFSVFRFGPDRRRSFAVLA
jgi:uncharacterized protein